MRRQRWPGGFRCPRCGGTRAWSLRTRALDQCASCHHQVSLTAGTVFHGTRKPLRVWFRVIGQFVASKSGCSAMDVSRQHRLKYETAWTWLHKLRSCMVQFGRVPLSGSVEVDETYLGGEDDDAHKGRSLAGHKTPVAAAVEERGEAMGRIRLIAVLNATALSLCGFVRQYVAPGAHVKTDGLQSYRLLRRLGFQHQRVVLGTNPKNAIKQMPNVHRVFSLLRRWLLGTYQGAVHPIHLQSYLDEFVFRFNRRRSANRWLLFQRLLERAFARQQPLIMTNQGAVNGPTFLRFVKRRLVPWLKRGDVVILDNLNIHKMAAVRRALESAGALPVYLPTYSPELNPIELLWSDLKRELRRMGLDTVEALRRELRRLRASLPLRRISGWFRHALAQAQNK